MAEERPHLATDRTSTEAATIADVIIADVAITVVDTVNTNMAA